MKNVPDTVPVNAQLSPDIIWKIWSRGEIFAGNDPVFWRRDVCGAWIFRSHYNRKDSEYGWVIDRINPTLEGDADTISNFNRSLTTRVHEERNFPKQLCHPLDFVFTIF